MHESYGEKLSSLGLEHGYGHRPEVKPSRSRLRYFLLVLLVLTGTPFYLLTRDAIAIPSFAPSSLSFCPTSSPNSLVVPTLILQASEKTSERWGNRTYWVKDDSFLPYREPLRLSQQNVGSPTWTSKVSAAKRQQSPSLPISSSGDSSRVKLCPIYQVPSSPAPEVPSRFDTNGIMFGMSTLPERVLYNLPVWLHWLPTTAGSIVMKRESDLSTALELSPRRLVKKALASPVILVLTPPLNATGNATRNVALDQAASRGMNVQIRPRFADRFEERYLAMVQELWIESEARETAQGIVTEWFIFADDDTFFPDFSSLARLLANYDSSEDHLIGALSEATGQVQEFGVMAFGGAGIHISKGLMRKMNAPGVYNKCVEFFGGSFGGDTMVSMCAAYAVGNYTTFPETQAGLSQLLKQDRTLHQMDIEGDATGFFQSGFLLTSIHHLFTWAVLFPPGGARVQDLRKDVLLVGKAAKLLGGDNFGRRFVFNAGKAVVSLGYSLTLFANGLTPADLARTEHTWTKLETQHPMRARQVEGLDKRTYYLTSSRLVREGVTVLEHANSDGERVDIIWDAREKDPRMIQRETTTPVEQGSEEGHPQWRRMRSQVRREAALMG